MMVAVDGSVSFLCMGITVWSSFQAEFWKFMLHDMQRIPDHIRLIFSLGQLVDDELELFDEFGRFVLRIPHVHLQLVHFTLNIDLDLVDFRLQLMEFYNPDRFENFGINGADFHPGLINSFIYVSAIVLLGIFDVHNR